MPEDQEAQTVRPSLPINLMDNLRAKDSPLQEVPAVPPSKAPLLEQKQSDQVPAQPSRASQKSRPSTSQVLSDNANIEGQHRSRDTSQEPMKDAKPAPPKQTKKERDWDNYFRYRFGPFIILILWIVMSDLDKATFYAPTPSECREFAPHGARIAAKIESLLKVPEWVHEALMTSDDITSLAMLVVSYLDRIGKLPSFASKVKKTVNEQVTRPDEPIPATGANLNGAGDLPDISQVVGIGAQYIPG
jgi:hypothetical protein